MGIFTNTNSEHNLGRQNATTFLPAVTGLNGATANGLSTAILVEGYNGAMIVEAWNTGTGAVALSLEQSIDNSTWWGVGFDVMASGSAVTTGTSAASAAVVGTLTRVASVTLAASGTSGAAQRLAILDPCVWLRFRLSSAVATPAAFVQLLAVAA